jgi:hypothetical protein
MNAPSRAPRTTADHNGVTIAAILMMLIGWGGLYGLITTELPRVGARWLFFVLMFMAVTGTVLPVIRWVNVRITPRSRILPPGGVLVRQAVWIGLFAVTCAWLQIPRVLSAPIAFFLALALLVIEVFLRSREIPNEDR